jgi:uncharacterized protein YndB with AHSA1/START domain
MRALVNVTKIVDVSSDSVWAAISAIAGLDRWFPVIASCHVEGAGVGAVRVMELEGGGKIVDRVTEIDPQQRRFRYERTESPFPVSLYLGTVQLRDAGEGRTEVSWIVEMEVDAEKRQGVAEFIHEALSGGISGLEKDLQKQQR